MKQDKRTLQKRWLVMFPVISFLAVAALLSFWCFHKMEMGREFAIRGLSRDWEGMISAVRSGDVDAVDLYLRDGYSPYAFFWWFWEERILENAVIHGQRDILLKLIDAGARINRPYGNDQRQLIHLAARSLQPDVLYLLLMHGADPNCRGKPGIEGGALVPLESALLGGSDRSESVDRIRTVQILLEAGANPNVVYENTGGSLFQMAVGSGYLKIAEMMVQKGASINYADNEGITALIVAAYVGNETAVEWLLQRGALVNAVSNKGTAITRAAERGHAGTVKILLKYGADPYLERLKPSTEMAQ